MNFQETTTTETLRKFRAIFALGLSSILAITLVSTASSAGADEAAADAIAGTFSIGDASAGIDQRRGTFNLTAPLLAMPGDLGGDLTLSLTYTHDNAHANNATDTLVGRGWSLGLPHVNTSQELALVTASGTSHAIDMSLKSGLSRYLQEDLVFSVEDGVLPGRPGIAEPRPYAYVLSHLGGLTDYFGSTGNLIARSNSYGTRFDIHNDSDGRITHVTDGANNVARFDWSAEGLTITHPRNSNFSSDTLSAATSEATQTRVSTRGGLLDSITNPAGETTSFGYAHNGLMADVTTPTGAHTTISYEEYFAALPPLVRRLTTSDLTTGRELLVREWKPLGEHNSYGTPRFGSEKELWFSGDGSYRYSTEMSDGRTRVRADYNSLGLLQTQHIAVTTSHGEKQVHTQSHIYSAQHSDPALLPAHFDKPVQTRVAYHDLANPLSPDRVTTEEFQFDNSGRLVHHKSADGSITRAMYDTEIPGGRRLAIGHILEHSTSGQDGATARTINTLTPDRAAIASTYTATSATPGAAVDSEGVARTRTDYAVDARGFLTEKKQLSLTPVADGPSEILTRYSRTLDRDAGTLTLTRTDAAGTDAQTAQSTIYDTATGLPVRHVDVLGGESAARYDHANRLVSETDTAGRITTRGYAPHTSTTTDPTGLTISRHSDALGRPTRVTDNIANNTPTPGVERVVEERTYEDASTTVVTDVYGRKTTVRTDPMGRVVETTTPTGLMHMTRYNDHANTVTSALTDPDSTSTLTMSGPETAVARSSMATPGNESSRIPGAPLTGITQLDELGRAIHTSSIREDGYPVPEQTQQYDGIGRTTRVQAGDIDTDVSFGTDGTPTTTTLTPKQPDLYPGSPVTAGRTFDMLGVPTQKTLASPGATSHSGVKRVFDAAGRVTEETDQNNQTTRYTYTPDGLTATIEAPEGTTTTNTFDPVSRLIVKTNTAGADSESVTCFEYDPMTENLLSVWDPSRPEDTRITYRYDGVGHAIEMIYPDGKRIQHSFDDTGRTRSTTDITGARTSYSYAEPSGLLREAQQTAPDGANIATVTYEHDQWGRIANTRFSNGVSTSYSYTSAHEIKAEHSKTAAGQTIYKAEYDYDTHGNLTRRTETAQVLENDSSAEKPADSTGSHSLNQTPQQVEQGGFFTETTDYSYNAYNQLLSSSVYSASTSADGPPKRTDYTIGLTGNVTGEIVTENGTQTRREYVHNPMGQITAVIENGVTKAQHYDAAGNLTQSADGTRFSYNLFNQLVTETKPDGTRVTNSYWVTGKQKSTTTHSTASPVTTETSHWAADRRVNETYNTHERPDPSTIASYLLANTRHARTLLSSSTATPGPLDWTLGSATSYYVSDRHGSTRALVDDRGNLTEHYAYSDYGKPTIARADDPFLPGARNPYQYSSEYTDTDGKQRLGARVYDPTIHSFTTRDTADQFNLYAYTGGNPITLVDPSGQTPETDMAINAATLGLITLNSVLDIVPFIAKEPHLAAFGAAFISAALSVGAAFLAALPLADRTSGDNIINPDHGGAMGYAGLGAAGGGFIASIAAVALSFAVKKRGPGGPPAPAATPPSTTTSVVRHAKGVELLSDDHLTELHQLAQIESMRRATHRNGKVKGWGHGTKLGGWTAIQKNGFSSDFRDAQEYGPGAYLTRYTTTAAAHADVLQYRLILSVRPVFDGKRTIKFTQTNTVGKYRIANPLYTKHERGESPWLAGGKKFSTQEAIQIAQDLDYDYSYFSHPTGKWKTLVVHKENADQELLPLTSISGWGTPPGFDPSKQVTASQRSQYPQTLTEKF